MNNWNAELAYVAFVDIMGYKQLVLNNDHRELLKIHTYSIPSSIGPDNSNQRHIRENGKDTRIGGNDPICVNAMMVSDSLIVWTPDDSPKSFLDIIYKIQCVIVESMMHYLPVRGAISLGPISLMNNLSTDDIIQASLCGKPIVEAYLESENTDWIGCVVMDKCIEHYVEKYTNGDNSVSLEELLSRKILVKYKVPYKEGPIRTKLAINWTLNYGWDKIVHMRKQRLSVAEWVGKNFSSLNKNADNWSVERKVKNTIAFIQAVSDIDVNYKYWPYAVEISDIDS